MTGRATAERDEALRRLRRLTAAVAVGAGGAVVGLGYVAAVTVPGKPSTSVAAAAAGGAATVDPSSQDPGAGGGGVSAPDSGSQDPSAGGALQAPVQAPEPGVGSGQARSGGS